MRRSELDSDTTWGFFGTTDQQAVERLDAHLGTSGCASPSADQPVQLLFFDTFDWRIFRKGWALVLEDTLYRLRDRKTGKLLAEQSVAPTNIPRFTWDLEPGRLREHLAPVIKVRALLRLLTIGGVVRTREITHPKSEQRWLLEHHSFSLSRRGREIRFIDTIAPRPEGTGRRGRKWVTRLILDAGFGPVPPTLLESALATGGIQPRGYSSKIKVPLEPDLPAGEAALLIAGHLLKNMKANLPGVRKDIDTEFLHDFRVAVRRTRSLLSLMKGVFPTGVRHEAQALFSRIGDMTGPLRDLDVYLLRYPDHLEMLPAEFHPGLKEIFVRVARRRAAVRREMEASLEDNELNVLLQEWSQFLAEGIAAWEEAPKKARQSIGTLANKMIANRYRRLLKLGSAGGREITDEDLHRLRIEGKKLRYSLEFFASLYSGRTISGLLATLKKLQDHLGDHNDTVLQMADLRSLLEAKGVNRLSPQAAAAAGALILKLGQSKAEIRDRFAEVFTGFAGPETAKDVKRLTGSG